MTFKLFEDYNEIDQQLPLTRKSKKFFGILYFLLFILAIGFTFDVLSPNNRLQDMKFFIPFFILILLVLAYEGIRNKYLITYFWFPFIPTEHKGRGAVFMGLMAGTFALVLVILLVKELTGL